jgi:hypothetical protein
MWALILIICAGGWPCEFQTLSVTFESHDACERVAADLREQTMDQMTRYLISPSPVENYLRTRCHSLR